MNAINFTCAKTKAPCKDCPDRKVGCHSECKKYIEWKQIHDREVEAVKKQRDIEIMNVERIRRITGITCKEK